MKPENDVKLDSGNKAVNIFADLMKLFDSKPRAFTTVGMILVICYLWYRNDQWARNAISMEREFRKGAISMEREFRKEMTAEIRKQITPVAHDLKRQQDSSLVKIDSTREELKPVIQSIKETVKKINDKR